MGNGGFVAAILIAVGIFLASRKGSPEGNVAADGSFTAAGGGSIPEGTITPGGVPINIAIHTPQQGVDYINQMLQSPTRTMPSGAVVVPRAGGGYTQVGAPNVKLNPPSAKLKENQARARESYEKAKSSKKTKPWNQYR